MSAFFSLVEISLYLSSIYFLFYKKELAIIYLPGILFASAIITPKLPPLADYILLSIFVVFFIYYNIDFIKENIFSIFLFVLYIVLIPNSSDFLFIRSALFSVMCLFLLIPLVMSIYQKYPRVILFNELQQSAFIILSLFIINVIFSSFFNYAPHEMYGITSGILYGNLRDTDFNILTMALFILLFYLTGKTKLVYLVVALMSFTFIILSLRRSVIILCIVGFIFVFLILLAKKEGFKVFVIGSLIFLFGIVIIQQTGFLSLFQERYELRNLGNRNLTEEGRFVEYELLYYDIFIHQDYSPWLGYELLNSGGHYGKGIFGERSLHGDLTNIIHSTGIVGLVLYLFMIFTTFWQAFKHGRSVTDLLIILFCFMAFIIFTITGRYTQLGYMLLFFLVLLLPLGKVKEEKPIPHRPKADPVLIPQ